MKLYLSVLNMLSCLAVVILHANGVFGEFSYENYWVSANIIESIFYFGVPIFCMISGVTLLDYREKYSTKIFLKKRFMKIVLPFLMWSLFGFCWEILFKRINILDLTVIGIIDSIFNTRYTGIYWFLIAISTVYLCIPVLGVFREDERRSTYGYIIVLTLILNYCLPFLFSLTKEMLMFNGALCMPFGGSLLIYPVLGYCIDRYPLIKRKRLGIYFSGILGVILHIMGTWILSYKASMIVYTYVTANLFKHKPALLDCQGLARYNVIIISERKPQRTPSSKIAVL